MYRIITGKFRNDQDIGLTLFVMHESAERSRPLRTKSGQYRKSFLNLPVYILFIARLKSINHNYYNTYG